MTASSQSRPVRGGWLLEGALLALVFAATVWAVPVGAATVFPGPIFDAQGDFPSTYAGERNADLDVRFAQVVYNPGAQTLSFISQMWGSIGQTPGGFYVWGINRGPGTEGFNLPTSDPRTGAGVFFDTVVVLRPGQPTLGAPVVLSSISAPDDTISVTIPITFGTPLFPDPFPPTFLPIDQWTYNLWPRTGSLVGNIAISDFAPDAANILASVVPEPMSLIAMGTGVGFVLALTVWKHRATRAA